MRPRFSNWVLQRCVAAATFVPAVLVVVAWPSTSWARSRGIMATSCSGCHGGADAATVTARTEPAQIEPGNTGTLIIEVSSNGIAGAGLSIFAIDGGTFSIPQGQPLSASGDWVTHDQPKAAMDGKVEFRVDWTAPDEIGVALFEIAALATNGNNGVSGDKPGGTNLTVGHGCEPMTMYFDSDGDGFGREDSWIASCGNDDGYVAVFGDCADSDVERNPDATEVCNGLDDDCDGEVDEGVVAGVFYRDFDEDGFGDPNTTTETCTPEGGYVSNGDDCDDRAADNHPGGAEICDYVDNNCDGEVDEELRPTCGLGLCRRVSDVCDSAALCSPGEPFEEVCNSLDDDCDGETDEEGCPEGQGCFNNSCVDVGAIPSTPPPTPPPPAPSDPDGPSTTVVDGSDTNATSDSTNDASESNQPEPSASSGIETTPTGTTRSEPSSTGCGVVVSPRTDVFGLFSIALVLGSWVRRRKT
jgi:hypothetical protein